MSTSSHPDEATNIGNTTSSRSPSSSNLHSHMSGQSVTGQPPPASTPPPIRRLASDVAHMIRSGFVITDLSQAIQELVCNSIDANATRIHVAVELEALSFCVVDNGTYTIWDEDSLTGKRVNYSHIVFVLLCRKLI